MFDAHRPNLWTFPALTGDTVAPLVEDSPVRPDATPADVRDVFAAWVDATGRDPARTRLTVQRRKKVDARLREGYDVGELTAAVRGIALSAWHRGENDTGTRYDDLTVALRDGGQVERFAALWEQRDQPRQDRHPVTGRRARGCARCENGFVLHDDGSVSVCDCPETSGDL